ncbi:DUF885 domain-containing protein [Umezawaea beigongshangensis]|uniref:DUF885 domain-containing protein n=1 Tax=Umezawaea beigongshangensis TaxID=2780383 RepID=UPI0018F10E7F|nr:DUF885 domain-containing protein [Umezawaea beigongshangensis]
MTTVRELADETWELLLDHEPLFATLLGIPGRDDRLRDLSAEASAALRARAEDVVRRAPAATAESDEDEVTRAVAVQQARSLIDTLDAATLDHAVAYGFASPVGSLLSHVALIRPVHEQAQRDLLVRLAAIPRYLEQAAQRHLAAVREGRFPLAHLVEEGAALVDRYLADPDADPLRIPELDADLAEERDALLADVVRPAFARYRDVLRTDIAPHGRDADHPGLSWLPGGPDRYAALVRVHTTTDRTPEELHRTGLELTAALDREYEEIGARVFGPGTAAEVRQRLRTDPAMKWTSAQEMLDAARATIERAEREAPNWFGRLPRSRCVVEPVPEAEAPNTAGAYYAEPTLDGSRPGTYFTNTHEVRGRDRFIAESVAFHEAVPGHHFQLTIAQELGHLPLLRRFALVNAYTEGWALYAERLADEMGLFSDDLARLGMLAEDSMRAARLVVDTGLHAFGWTRQQVVDHLRENTVMSEVEIQSETDRYVEDPAQALSYTVGRAEIQRLRALAAEIAGERFDLRGFHDLLLGGGPLPMTVLAGVVESWARSL